MVIEYWNGREWRKEGHEYLDEDAKTLIDMAMDSRARCRCRSLGYNICRCASLSHRDKVTFSRAVGEMVYSTHQPQWNVAHSGIIYGYSGRIMSGTATIPLENIIDKWLLEPGDLIFEASL